MNKLTTKERKKILARWYNDCNSGEKIVPNKEKLEKRLLFAQDVLNNFMNQYYEWSDVADTELYDTFDGNCRYLISQCETKIVALTNSSNLSENDLFWAQYRLFRLIEEMTQEFTNFFTHI